MTWAATALGVIAAPAGAATTIGQTFTSNIACGGNEFVQVAEGAGVPSYAVPSRGGVITSWSTRSATGDDMAFKVFRPTGTPNQYTVIGASALTTLPGGLATFTTRIPVQGGDRIGFYSDTQTQCVQSSTGSLDAFLNFNEPVGTTHTYTSGGAQVIDVAASVEPDADHDGFGDETQDACPTDATTQGVCLADLSVTKVADRAVAGVGDDVVYTIGVKNGGPHATASSVSVTDALPPNVALVSAVSTRGSCAGPVTCSLGDLASGEAATITVVVRTTAAGPATDRATVTSATVDPNQGDNSATAATSVLAAFPGVTLASLRTVSIDAKGRGTVGIPCPAVADGQCAGAGVFASASKIVLRDAVKGKIQKLSSFAFSGIQPGTTKKVKFKLSKKALKLLATKGTLKSVLTVSSHDSRNTAKKTSAHVTLKSAARKRH